MPGQTQIPFSVVQGTNRIGRALALMALYIAVLGACRYAAYEIRFDFIVPHDFQQERLLSLAISIPIKLAFLLLFRQFGSLLTYFSVPDLMRIAAAMACANLTSYALRLGLPLGLTSPRGVVLTDFVFSVGALSALRLGFRIYRERYTATKLPTGKSPRRVAVLGAGDAGAQLVGEVLSKPSLGLRPVFFLDDDWKKHGNAIHGVPVLGTPDEIAKWRKEYPVDACVLAMPTAPGKRLQEIFKVMLAEGLKVEIVPSLAELATGRVQVSKIRPVQVEDLLGRPAVDLRSPEVEDMVRDKVVMVTGAGGSIGSELCRQLAAHNPQRLLLVEQAEGSLFTIESELNDLGHRNAILPLVADILDLPRMRSIFERYHPSIVFHAAAHKHVFMMERQPGEAVKNNTTGTRQLAELAAEKGVEAFVLISTDKAINPTSAMGASKRLAEMHLQALQRTVCAAKKPETGNLKPENSGGNSGLKSQVSGLSANPQVSGFSSQVSPGGYATRFIAVRFGNVLGSSGSVIPIFKQQIAAGGPVTVTHPDVTRYFMTIPEAVGLVLRTAVLGKGGEIFVLDMGKPMKIVDLARQLIELSGLRPGEDIEIKFVGLRPGEKLFEELQHKTENLLPTAHERIHLLASNGAHDAAWVTECRLQVEEQAGALEPNQLKQVIQKFVPEYTPHLD